MELIYYIDFIFIFLAGLCVGSFLNVGIYRIPLGKSVVSPRSSCPGCGKQIGDRDLIPVLSYLILRGRCRECGERISIRYPLIEILTAVLITFVYIKFGLSLKFLTFSIITSILILIFFIDLEHMIIPDGLNLLIGVLGVTLNIVYPKNISLSGSYKETILSMLFGFLLGGGLFFILALFGAMGGGDIKLMAALGLVFGWKLMIPLMLLSFMLGGVIGISLLAFKVKKMKDMIPFGPYITVASVIMIFEGTNLINWYLTNFIY